MRLDRAWQHALDLAWQSFCAGTTPVGAVIVNDAGDVVAHGRVGAAFGPSIRPWPPRSQAICSSG